MKKLIEKVWMVLAGMKSIIGISDNSKPETYCEMIRREKREEALREQEGEKKDSGKFAY